MSKKPPERNAQVIGVLVGEYNSLRRRASSRYRGFDADDLTQEAYLRALSTPTRSVQDAPAYMRKTLKSVVVDTLRKIKRRPWTIFRDPEIRRTNGDGEPEAVLDVGEMGDSRNMQQLEAQIDLEALVARLPPSVAATLILHKRDGFSYDEIATKMGVCTATVRNRLAKAYELCTALALEAKYRGTDR